MTRVDVFDASFKVHFFSCPAWSKKCTFLWIHKRLLCCVALAKNWIFMAWRMAAELHKSHALCAVISLIWVNLCCWQQSDLFLVWCILRSKLLCSMKKMPKNLFISFLNSGIMKKREKKAFILWLWMSLTLKDEPTFRSKAHIICTLSHYSLPPWLMIRRNRLVNITSQLLCQQPDQFSSFYIQPWIGNFCSLTWLWTKLTYFDVIPCYLALATNPYNFTFGQVPTSCACKNPLELKTQF